MTECVRARDEIWRVESKIESSGSVLYQLRSMETGAALKLASPPDFVEVLPSAEPVLDRRALAPFALWQLHHELIALTSPGEEPAALHAGRVQLEPFQLVPVGRLFSGPHRNLLVADDVGLGKTVEAGLCLLELIARGFGERILLVVPPGLIDQWVDEMHAKFGLAFRSIEDSAALDQAQIALAEGISPWSFHDRVITSVEYLKRPEIYRQALRRPWDVIVVDEAHYLAESGSPANPYHTRRSQLGLELRKHTRSLILLTATPHNGYRHSFRSLLELVEPTEATLAGSDAAVRGRVRRSMVRRLKRQITRTGENGERVPAFVPRAPVKRLEVRCGSEEERAIFGLVARYCSRTAAAAEQTEQRDLVSFAMQIVKKRMLSSRLALRRTVEARLDALKSASDEEPPGRAEVHELQSDVPLPEQQAERLVARVIRGAVPREAKRRTAEKRQLQEILRALRRVEQTPDPKIERLLSELRADVLSIPGEKAIVFTEYRDTLESIRDALDDEPELRGSFVELTGGLTARQRRERIAAFARPECRVLLATDAASEGLNLQHHCHRIYHLELCWNPNRLEQRNGRIDRFGQQRTPQIAYLFYADSPEDRVLDRLVARISGMQDDQVSTPDIVGIIETTRLPERLLDLTSDEDVDRVGDSLMRVFEEETDSFRREIAPLLAAGDPGDDPSAATSADPVLQDDLAFEDAMLRLLGAACRPGAHAHEFRVAVPIAFQGPGVPPEYPAVTFRRSVALADGMEGTEFVHRLHPLARAAAAHCRAALRHSTAPGGLPPFLAARGFGGQRPAVVFTYGDPSPGQNAGVLAVGVSADGALLPESEVADALAGTPMPGDVPWSECERLVGPVFQTMQTRAAQAAHDLVCSRLADERDHRARVAGELRAEVDAYRIDRLAELAREEEAERAGTREQTDLFRETRTNWAARRAAVETHAAERLRQIAEWEAPPEPPSLEPLGVLILMPGVAS